VVTRREPARQRRQDGLAHARMAEAVPYLGYVVAAAAAKLLSRPPADLDDAQLARLATRGRGLLAHGTGRLAIYTLGQRLKVNTTTRRSRTRRSR